MRFACDACQAQYLIRDDKVGPAGVAVRCKRCGQRIVLRPTETAAQAEPPDELDRALDRVLATPTRVMSLGEMAGLLHADPPPPADERNDEEPVGFKAAGAEWFVAIGESEETQVGPLTVEQVRERWTHGEVSATSLCWRAGMRDWSPLSSVPTLAALLVPGAPAKPEPAGAIATALQAPLPPPPSQAEGAAASAFAALVHDELRALESLQAPVASSSPLIDVAEVEDEEPPARAESEIVLAQPVFSPAPSLEPSLEPSVLAPRATAAPTLAWPIAIGVVASLLIIGGTAVVVARLLRPQVQVAAPAPVVAIAAPAPKPAPPVEAPAIAAGRAEPEPTPAPERRPDVPARVEPAPAVALPRTDAARTPPDQKQKRTRAAVAPSTPATPSEDPTDAAFRHLFEQGRAPEVEPRAEKASLERSDILAVLAANKAGLQSCTASARAAGSSGTVVMRWLIRGDGSTANIQTVTEEFQKTPLAECLARAIGRLRFPAYSGPQLQPIDVPLKF